MKTYTLKSVARRGSMLGAAFVVAAASFLPASFASADALNPLTDRSLTLSSSAPGWDYKDGSGNDTYAMPNSGANGQKTGNTFSFKVSTDSSTATGTDEAIQAFTFQYCTQPAGICDAPGNNTMGAGPTYTRTDSVENQESDLNIVTATPSEVDNTGDTFFNSTTGVVSAVPDRDNTEGNYMVMVKDVAAGTWSQSDDWVMTTTHNEDGQVVGTDPGATGKNNFITLTNAVDGLKLQTGGEVKIVFFGTDTNYITNPGEGAFFVKINNYKSTTTFDDTTLVDGGVTVANVMNLGIEIQTKVLETMDFSVGTVDPYTLSNAQLVTASEGSRTTHGVCDPILNSMNPATDEANTLLLGSEVGESSLETDHTYSTHSYFRLSSNASAGATVYYSGVTLSNTVGDQIAPIGPNKIAPSPGSEQFGLALANGEAGPDYLVDYTTERTEGEVYESAADNAAEGLLALNPSDPVATPPSGTGVHTSVATDWTAAGISGKLPQLKVNADGTALAPLANYNEGAGTVNGGGSYGAIETKFAFDSTSNMIPVAIASEDQRVVDCASAKVRYIANIAATTPAGIYTTKINFIAAPQY